MNVQLLDQAMRLQLRDLVMSLHYMLKKPMLNFLRKSVNNILVFFLIRVCGDRISTKIRQIQTQQSKMCKYLHFVEINLFIKM